MNKTKAVMFPTPTKYGVRIPSDVTALRFRIFRAWFSRSFDQRWWNPGAAVIPNVSPLHDESPDHGFYRSNGHGQLFHDLLPNILHDITFHHDWAKPILPPRMADETNILHASDIYHEQDTSIPQPMNSQVRVVTPTTSTRSGGGTPIEIPTPTCP